MTAAARAAALAFALCATLARAAPHEINVFTDEVEEPGHTGLEMHVNTARGRTQPDYPGEIPPGGVLRVMPELVVGIAPGWEVGLHLPMQFDRTGQLHPDGLRVRLKHVLPRDEKQPFFAGVNFEWGYDQPHLSEDRHNLEVRGIAGWRTDEWLVAGNAILAWVAKGANRSGKPDFEASLKVAREVREGLALGIEHYAGFGRLSRFAPRRDQDHVLYFAADIEHKGWSVNVGLGRGLTRAADDVVLKAIVGIPLK